MSKHEAQIKLDQVERDLNKLYRRWWDASIANASSLLDMIDEEMEVLYIVQAYLKSFLKD